MPEDKKVEDMESVEDFVIATLTNEPSEPLEIKKYNVRLVFQRPSVINKFKHRAWAHRKLKEIGAEDSDEQIGFLFRYWGTLNSYVIRILVPDKKGSITVDGKKYVDYEYDFETELDYKSIFEKYVMEEVYNKGKSEEAFLSDVIMVHANWVNENTSIKDEDDIKNS